MAANRLLIIDDDRDTSALFRDAAESLGLDVRVLNDSGYFAEAVDKFRPEIIVLGLELPRQDGIELLRQLAARRSRARILIGSILETRVLKTAEQLGKTLGLNVVGTFCKPIDPNVLTALLSAHSPRAFRLTTDELSFAIDAGQLVVHYLPKATHRDDGSWIVDGVEALVRWQHEKHGLIYPNEFLPLAEQSGLIVGLTDYVMRAALEQASTWVSQGHRFDLGLNLAAGFLADLEFPDRLVALIRENHLEPSMVTLELTETSALVDPELAMDILARLRLKGVKLCLDDFGVGRSSLTHLYKMPFNEVKLDNAFVRDMQSSTDARNTVEGLIYLVHKLDMSACAEGVEDEATFRQLEQFGCDRIQGHHIGPALPARELLTVAANWNARHAPSATPSFLPSEHNRSA